MHYAKIRKLEKTVTKYSSYTNDLRFLFVAITLSKDLQL